MRPLILNAEDNQDDIMLMDRACRRAQPAFDISYVGDGQAAVDYLAGTGSYSDRARHPLPSLVLLDLKMPKKTGLEVLHWIRGNSGLRPMAAAIFTSSANEDDVKAAFDHGADCYLYKPASYQSLLVLVQKLGEALNDTAVPLAESLRQLPGSVQPL